MNVNMLKLWMRTASPAERDRLAARVKTSRGNLEQYAGGFRQPSALRGAVIERATAEMHRTSKGRLPKVYRTDLVKACRQCEFAEKCLGKAVIVRAEFEVVQAKGGAK